MESLELSRKGVSMGGSGENGTMVFYPDTMRTDETVREEGNGFVVAAASLAVIFLGLVGIFFSGFVAMNIGTLLGFLIGVAGVICIFKFRKMSYPAASRMVAFGILVVFIGILFEMVVGLMDHNILSAYSGLLILAGTIVAGVLWLWEER